MNLFSTIKKINKAIFLLSVILLIASYFQKNKLPDASFLSDKLYINPVQSETREKPFEVEKNGTTYKIVPLYNYELNGLIVSSHNSNSWYDYYHNEWKDYINIKDLCVVWGDNIKNDVYKNANFSSGSFSCRVSFKGNVKFSGSFLSNNHILYEDQKIYEAVKSAEAGDQIHFKGYLVNYSNLSNDFSRGTSITRDDTGGQACETIFVTDFEIIRKGNILWHNIFDVSKYAIIISFILMIYIFIKEPVFSSEGEDSGWKKCE